VTTAKRSLVGKDAQLKATDLSGGTSDFFATIGVMPAIVLNALPNFV
jgi:hypothetical protein